MELYLPISYNFFISSSNFIRSLFFIIPVIIDFLKLINKYVNNHIKKYKEINEFKKVF